MCVSARLQGFWQTQLLRGSRNTLNIHTHTVSVNVHWQGNHETTKPHAQASNTIHVRMYTDYTHCQIISSSLKVEFSALADAITLSSTGTSQNATQVTININREGENQTLFAQNLNYTSKRLILPFLKNLSKCQSTFHFYHCLFWFTSLWIFLFFFFIDVAADPFNPKHLRLCLTNAYLQNTCLWAHQTLNRTPID